MISGTSSIDNFFLNGTGLSPMGGLLWDAQTGVKFNPFSRKGAYPQVMNYMVPRFYWYTLISNIVLELMAARFEWTGLPKGMPRYYLEKGLVQNGYAAIFRSKSEGLFVGVGNVEGQNHYGMPLKFHVISTVRNDIFDLPSPDCVLVQNNSQMYGDYAQVDSYVRLLAEIKVAQGINLQVQKTPFLLTGNEKLRNTLYTALNQITEGQTHIMLDPEMTDKINKPLDVLKLDPPYLLDRLQMYYNDVKGEMLEVLGINSNPQPDKRERMIVDEIAANNEFTSINRVTMLKLREDAAAEASDKFNTTITVKECDAFDNVNFSERLDRIGHSDGDGGSPDAQRPVVPGNE